VGIGAIVTGHGLEIDTALSGDGPIASEQVLPWIDAAADSDLLALHVRDDGLRWRKFKPSFLQELLNERFSNALSLDQNLQRNSSASSGFSRHPTLSRWFSIHQERRI
jgi:hypothetical protein